MLLFFHVITEPLFFCFIRAKFLFLLGLWTSFCRRFYFVLYSLFVSAVCVESCGSASSAPQTDVEDGRNPTIKKSLFPLFSSKNSLKHNSAVKVLPVVASPLVQHQPAAPYPASPVIQLSSCMASCFSILSDPLCLRGFQLFHELKLPASCASISRAECKLSRLTLHRKALISCCTVSRS